jgi:hypothetical protein
MADFSTEGKDLIAKSPNGGLYVAVLICGAYAIKHEYLPPSVAEMYEIRDGKVWYKRATKSS